VQLVAVAHTRAFLLVANLFIDVCLQILGRLVVRLGKHQLVQNFYGVPVRTLVVKFFAPGHDVLGQNIFDESSQIQTDPDCGFIAAAIQAVYTPLVGTPYQYGNTRKRRSRWRCKKNSARAPTGTTRSAGRPKTGLTSLASSN
jgi:hypothetical protein